MQIAVASDLHTELYKDNGVSVITTLIERTSEADILVLAGDIFSLKHDYWPRKLLEMICKIHKYVIMVIGNHEYYRTSIDKAKENLNFIKLQFPNLHLLEAGIPQVIQGRRFLGDTLWFRDHPTNSIYYDRMNDFSTIKGFVPWVYDTNAETIRGLESNLQDNDIVVTHHLPSNKSIHEEFKESPINRFFVCDLSNLIIEKKPSLWIHGHTHYPIDVQLNSTRIYCNPLGYKGENENPQFWERLIIHV